MFVASMVMDEMLELTRNEIESQKTSAKRQKIRKKKNQMNCGVSSMNTIFAYIRTSTALSTKNQNRTQLTKIKISDQTIRRIKRIETQEKNSQAKAKMVNWLSAAQRKRSESSESEYWNDMKNQNDTGIYTCDVCEASAARCSPIECCVSAAPHTDINLGEWKK